MTLLAIIIAFALFHWVHKPDWMTSFDVFDDLNVFLRDKLGVDVVPARIVLILVVPLLILALLLELFDVSAFHHHGGVRYLLIHSLILFYCLGPKPIETAIDNGELFEDLKLSDNSSHKSIISGMTDAALHRWFGVFVWYLVIGLWGALLYRVAQQLSESELDSPKMKSGMNYLMRALNFIPALLMTVALAVASDFEKVWHKCKPFINSETLTELNCQFLYDAMYHSVEHGEIEALLEESDVEQNNEKQSETEQVVKTTMAVLKRMLVACLVFVALLVIFSAR